MERPHVIESSAADRVRVVQLTDCHIFGNADDRLLGMDTRESLRATLELLHGRDADADLLLLTGDLSQDGTADSYRHIARQLDSLDLPGFWLPGNHDDSAIMARHFDSERLSAAKRVRVSNWQILLLDSTLAGEVHGQVSKAQLDFLDAALEQEAQAHALVCLHHQALEMGSRWIDRKGLREAEHLRERLLGHDNVRGVLWGHVHQESLRRQHGIDWISTPSTCVQFMPKAEDFAVEPVAPGYRSLILNADGSIETAVHRVEDFVIDQETNSPGY